MPPSAELHCEFVKHKSIFKERFLLFMFSVSMFESTNTQTCTSGSSDLENKVNLFLWFLHPRSSCFSVFVHHVCLCVNVEIHVCADMYSCFLHSFSCGWVCLCVCVLRGGGFVCVCMLIWQLIVLCLWFR